MRKLDLANLKLIGSLFVLLFLFASIAVVVNYLPQQRGTQPRAASDVLRPIKNAPDGADWQVNGCSEKWQCVDEATLSISDYISVDRSGSQATFYSSTSPMNYSTINGVIVKYVARTNSSTGPNSTRAIGVYGGSLPQDGCNQTLSTSWTTYSCTFPNSPEGTPWTVMEINILRFGVYSIGTQTTYVAQVWAEVDYTSQKPNADIKAKGSDGPITIAHNTSARISWTSSNATSCSVSPTGWTGISNSGISTGNLTSSQTYTLNCSGPVGTASDSLQVIVSAPPGDGGDGGNGTTPGNGGTTPGGGTRPGGGGTTPGGGTANVLNTLNLQISVPYLIGEMKVPVGIGSFRKEIEISPDEKEYPLDVKEANLSLGSSLTVVVGGNKTLIKKIQVTPNSETTAVNVGDLTLGDITGDNKIDDKDAVSFLDSLTKQTTKGDLNADGVANSFDWAIFLANFGKSGDF